MNILTIGESPYINTRNGRINGDILISLDAAGHKVNGLVWHHNVQYFLPNESKIHHFLDENGRQVCELHPFLGISGEIARFTYGVLKVCQPQIVITIGGYSDISFVSGIKAMYPHFFKWIAILSSGINERFKESLDYADCVITLNSESHTQVSKILSTKIVNCPYGPDVDFFTPNRNDLETCLFLNCGENSQISNVPAFLKAISLSGAQGTLHTNINDQGDYDLMLLMERFNLFDSLCLPSKFVSVREGISKESMYELYNQHQVIVECSMQSPTALGLLEAMATGCVPVGPEFDAVGDILNLMAKDYRFIVPSEMFVGAKEENYAIVSPHELAKVMKTLMDRFQNDKGWFMEAQTEATRVAKLFSRDIFSSSVNHTVQDIGASKHAIVVDSFE